MKFIKTFLLTLLLFCNTAFAERVTLMIMYPPGGPMDIASRHFQKYIKDKHDIDLTFVYKPGALTLIGSQELAKSPKDGSVLGAVNISDQAYVITKNLSFEYVGPMKKAPGVLVIRSDLGIDSYDKFVNELNKGTVFKIGTHTNNVNIHMHEIFEKTNPKSKQNMVPYNGAPPMLRDLLGGHVDVILIPMIIVQEYVKLGKLTVLASTSKIDRLPNITNLSDRYDFVDVSGFSLSLPPGTPANIVNKWKALLKEYVNDKEVQKEFINDYANVMLEGPEYIVKVMNYINSLNLPLNE